MNHPITSIKENEEKTTVKTIDHVEKKEEEEEEEVTLTNSPLECHLRQLGIDENRLCDPLISTRLSSSSHPVVGDSPSNTDRGGGGEIIWRDGDFVDVDEVFQRPSSFSSRFEGSSSERQTWRRRLRHWAPSPLRASFDSMATIAEDFETKIRGMWRMPTLADALRVCIKFFGFSEQLQTYMSRVHFHLFDRMIGVGFSSVLTEEDEHFMRNYWEVEKEKQNRLNRELRRNGMLHPTMIRLGILLWASLSYLFHQYVFSPTAHSSAWVPAIFIICFLLLLTPELITMWQHRVACRRADAIFAAFETYLATSREFTATSRLAMKLIQEFDFVEAGFVFVPEAAHASIAGTTTSPSTPSPSTPSGRPLTAAMEQLLVLKGSLFVALRNLFHSHRSATRDLMLELPLGTDLDTPSFYVAHIPLVEFGASLTLPFVTANGEHLAILRRSTDDFALTALKAMAQLAHLQASEFTRRLILSTSPQAFDNNSQNLVAEITVNFCFNVAKDLKPTISSLHHSYDFHRCQILARESASTRSPTTSSDSLFSASSPEAKLAATMHALDLRLQSALLRSREVEERCLERRDGGIDDAASKKEVVHAVVDCQVNDDAEFIVEAARSSVKSLERLGLEIDAAKAIWEDAVAKANAIIIEAGDGGGVKVAYGNVPFDENVVRRDTTNAVPTDQLPEVHHHDVIDEVFEGVVDEEEEARRRRGMMATKDSADGGFLDATDDEEAKERKRRKKEKEEMKRVLTELRPKLKERADMWEEREKVALRTAAVKEEGAVEKKMADGDASIREDEEDADGRKVSGGDEMRKVSVEDAVVDGCGDDGDQQTGIDGTMDQVDQVAEKKNEESKCNVVHERINESNPDQEAESPLSAVEANANCDTTTTDQIVVAEEESLLEIGEGPEAKVEEKTTSSSMPLTPTPTPRTLLRRSSSTKSPRIIPQHASPVAPTRDRRRREKTSLARWRSENELDGLAGDGGVRGLGGTGTGEGLVRVSWIKSLEMLNVKGDDGEGAAVPGEARRGIGRKPAMIVDIDIGEQPRRTKKETSSSTLEKLAPEEVRSNTLVDSAGTFSFAVPSRATKFAVAKNDSVIDLLIVNGGGISKDISFGIETKSSPPPPPIPKPRRCYSGGDIDTVFVENDDSFRRVVDSSEEGDIVGATVVRRDGCETMMEETIAEDKDKTNGGVETTNSPSWTSDATISSRIERKEFKATKPSPPIPSPPPSPLTPVSISQSSHVRPSPSLKSPSFERSHGSSLAGCLAHSPPARVSVDLAAGSYGFNKTLAQMAVAKSAEFRGAVDDSSSVFSYVEETFGDDISSEDEEDVD